MYRVLITTKRRKKYASLHAAMCLHLRSLGSDGQESIRPEYPVKVLAGKLGGKMLHFYHCFGDYDAVIIFESPDETAASAAVLAAISAGHLKSTKTTPLLTIEQSMEAMRKAGGIAYPPPKG